MRVLAESILYTQLELMGGQHEFSLSNKCVDSPFWDEWYPRLRFALFVISLVYYVLGMPVLFWWTRRKSETAKKMLQWHTYPVAIAFMALYLLLAVIGEGLLNCQKVTSLRYLKIWVAANVFRYLANVIILYIIILPLSDRMMRYARWEGHPLIGHWILMVFISIFMVLFVVMWNYNLLHSARGDETTDPNFGVESTYVTLYLVAALYAAGHLIAARVQGMRNKASQKGIMPWCPILPLSLIGLALLDFIAIFAFYVVPRTYTEAASSTFVLLGLFFQAFLYLSLPFLASSKALETGEAERLGSAHEEKAIHA